MAIDWTHLRKKYAGQWVAFKKDEKTVVAAAKTLTAVHKKAKESGYDRPAVFFVPKEDVSFVG